MAEIHRSGWCKVVVQIFRHDLAPRPPGLRGKRWRWGGQTLVGPAATTEPFLCQRAVSVLQKGPSLGKSRNKPIRFYRDGWS
jgi:hypothetical protein